MEKIKCPHCGAINQDVTPKDNCWQCGQPLAASAAGVETSPAQADAGGQKLKEGLTLEERVAARKAERKPNRAVPAIIALVLILLVIVLVLWLRR